MGVLLLVVSLTLAISAFCSLLEATLYSTRVVTLEAAKEKTRHRVSAERFLKMKRDITPPTSAILILNTVANTAGATIAGMYAAEYLGKAFVPVFSGAFTIAILLLAEIVPKTVGAKHWQHLWPFISLPLATLVRLLSPLVWLAGRFASLLTGESSLPAVTEDEIRASIHLGGKSGEVSPHELEMLEAVFRFEDTRAREVMVPRDEVVFADLSEPPAAFFELLDRTTYSRYPACRRSLDDIVGMLHVKDLSRVDRTADTKLEELVRDMPTLPETLSISEVMMHLQASRRQMAALVDELGTFSGLITVTDILEQIVGNLEDELDGPELPPFVREADGYTVRGNLSLDRINRELDWDLYDPAVVTLSGLLVSKLGRLLRRGDRVTLAEGVAEVIEVKANRASRIRLVPARARRGVAGGDDSATRTSEDEPEPPAQD